MSSVNGKAAAPYTACFQRLPDRLAARRNRPKMRFTGTTVLRLQNGKIVEAIGLDDGVTALTRLGLLKAA
jgi:hypothetical protein